MRPSLVGAVLGLALVNAACGGSTDSGPVATQIAKNGGDNQVAAAGTALAPLSVVVRDANSNPVAGVTVNWAVASGGGSVSASSSISDVSGIATITRTLGANAGTQTTSATKTGLTGSPLTFSAVAQIQGATQMALNAGNSQSDTVLATLGTAISVLVRDQNNAAVQGVTVNWTATGGGVSSPTSITNVGGIASVNYTLGGTAGANTATATVTGLAGSPVGFTLTATAGNAAVMTINGGNNQKGGVGTVLPVQHTVLVKDAHNNVKPGAAVTWVAGTGGGSVSNPAPVTNVNGIAGVSRTLGSAPGVQNDTARITGATGSPLVFADTAILIPTQMALDAGDAQVGPAGAALSAISVIVKDAANTPVPGVTVNWAAGSGGNVATPTSLTNGSGIASNTWTLGPNAGSQTATASVTGLTGSPVTFNAVAQIQGATQIALNAGNSQTDTVLSTLGTPLSVIVKDQTNTVVQGVTVNWSATGGGVSAPTSITDAGGIASIDYTLGATAGAQTAQATVTGLAGSPVNFSLTATAGLASTIALNAGNNQTGIINTALATAHSVIVKDSHNNPKAGFTVTWVAGDGGGSVSNGSPVTDVAGIASVTRTLGPLVGTQTDTAKAALTGSPVVFSATANNPPATQVAVGGVSNVFNPATVTISNGASVQWNFNGGTHNVTWLTGPTLPGFPVDSGDKTSGNYVVQFSTPGTYTYQCTNHPATMNGQVTVN